MEDELLMKIIDYEVRGHWTSMFIIGERPNGWLMKYHTFRIKRKYNRYKSRINETTRTY